MRYYYSITQLGTPGVHDPIGATGFIESDKTSDEVKKMIEDYNKKIHNPVKVQVWSVNFS